MMTPADYKGLLEHSFQMEQLGLGGCPPESRLEFLSESIFNFTTYDDEMAQLFGRKALFMKIGTALAIGALLAR